MTSTATLRNTNAMSDMNCCATAVSASVPSASVTSTGGAVLFGDKAKHARVGRQFVGLRNVTPDASHSKQRTASSVPGAIRSQVRLPREIAIEVEENNG